MFSVLFLENVEVCAKAHGQIWSGRPGFPVHDSPQATTLMAQRLGPSGYRSKMALTSSTSTSSTSSDQQSDILLHWPSAVVKVLLVQPSSAAAERVFSILNSSFNDSQEHALVDYFQACVMLQNNNR